MSYHVKVRQRDQGRCRGCGGKGIHVHHIVFRSQGGSDDLDNLVSVCLTCHQRAHNLVPNPIPAELFRAVLRLGGSVDGLKLKQTCFTCRWCQAGWCPVWEQQVDADYGCEVWRRVQ